MKVLFESTEGLVDAVRSTLACKESSKKISLKLGPILLFLTKV